VLGNFWWFISALLFIAGLIMHQLPLLLVSFLLLLVGGVARTWERYCLSRVEYHRKLSARRAFYGEEVTLEIEVANRKPLPLPWIETEDEIPEKIHLLQGRTSPSHLPDRLTLSNLFSLSWYHKVTRRYRMECRQRGYYTFGPVRLRSGDIFGFFIREETISTLDHLIVYPKMVPLEQLGIPSMQPQGDIRTRSDIFQDPILTMGIREYHFGDSLRRIHWKSSARLGQLQTRIFEPTTTVDMAIFLDVRTVEPPFWGIVPELLELAVTAAASIAKHALDKGYRVGLYVNQNRLSSEGLMKVPPGQSADQLQRILETLAQVHSSETMPMSRYLLDEARNLPWGSTLLVISAVPTGDLLGALFRMKRVGRRTALAAVGGEKPPVSADGLTVYHIRDDIPWNELETLNISQGARR